MPRLHAHTMQLGFRTPITTILPKKAAAAPRSWHRNLGEVADIYWSGPLDKAYLHPRW